MSESEFELDPDKRLWKPNRRSFFFGLGAALIAPMLPDVPEPAEKVWADVYGCVGGPGLSMRFVASYEIVNDGPITRLDLPFVLLHPKFSGRITA